MDRKSLLCGMGLGAAIAFGGMILGGQGAMQPAKPVNPPAVGAEWQDEIKARKITCEEIEVVNGRGVPMIRIRQAVNLGEIEILDDRQQRLVRLSGILRGGGTILTYENNRTTVEIGPTGQGGSVQAYAKEGKARATVGAVQAGGVIVTTNEAGEPTAIIPQEMNPQANPAPAAP